jgi:hypothetical protein
LPRTPAQYDSGEPASSSGPASSGRVAAMIAVCQPAWQLAITAGLPSAFGWRSRPSSMNAASAFHTSSVVWPGIGSGVNPTK